MARPRSFDSETILRLIRDQFWRHGYDGTSLDDIMAATGLKKGSLYAAFGDKRTMYRLSLEDYDRSEVESAVRLLRSNMSGAGMAAIGRLFDQVIADRAGASGRRGCFLCNASADRAPVDGQTETLVQSSLRRFTAAFSDALAGVPPFDGNRQARRAAAKMLMAVYVGMRVMARGGAPVSTLRAIRQSALSALSGPVAPR